MKLIKVTGFETNFSWSMVFEETASVADPDPGEVRMRRDHLARKHMSECVIIRKALVCSSAAISLCHNVRAKILYCF
jgi:hypothetical protein